MQNTFDNLYEQSSKDKKFKDLMKCITSKENILLAYRNIKKNKTILHLFSKDSNR